MSTHYSISDTTVLVDGVAYPVDMMGIAIAFGPDLSHPWIISFNLNANTELFNALKPNCLVEVDSITGKVDIVHTHPFALAHFTDYLVQCGLMPIEEYA